MRNGTRTLLRRTGATVLVVAGATGTMAASAASASATSDICKLTVHSVKAQDLQEANQDETFLRLGDTTTAVRTYNDNQTRRNLGNDDFVGSDRLRVIEDDPGAGNDDGIGSLNLPCQADSDTSVFTGSGAIYKVTWSVVVLP